MRFMPSLTCHAHDDHATAPAQPLQTKLVQTSDSIIVTWQPEPQAGAKILNMRIGPADQDAPISGKFWMGDCVQLVAEIVDRRSVGEFIVSSTVKGRTMICCMLLQAGSKRDEGGKAPSCGQRVFFDTSDEFRPKYHRDRRLKSSCFLKIARLKCPVHKPRILKCSAGSVINFSLVCVRVAVIARDL